VYQTYWAGRVLLLSLVLVGGLCFPAIAETSIQPNSKDSSSTNPSSLVEDIPEEILRSEIYTEARSPTDGSLLSAAEYIELNEALRETIDDIPPRFLVSEKVQRLIALLKLRKIIRTIIPFF